ncbi:hypothetical protein SAMN06313486_10152 [Epsilonproteobacteria bacterium SCGC AD-308-P11]|jgi:hypothetical protein|nr:hypothetical protein SAMN06313486_10152 [Epsilonproteobacteria bacterium SCGC AD-308-P11]
MNSTQKYLLILLFVVLSVCVAFGVYQPVLIAILFVGFAKIVLNNPKYKSWSNYAAKFF